MIEIDREDRERVLQLRIFETPTLLPGVDGRAAVATEVPIRRAGGADLIVVNAKGEITIVECKRASNPECRRKVIGQVFEYAAGLWKLEYEDLERLLHRFGTGLTKPFEDEAGWSEDAFRAVVARSLESASFRLIIAVDRMTKTLRRRLERTVALLDSHMQPSIRVLVIALPRGSNTPLVLGTDPAAVPRLPPRLKPDRSTLVNEIRARSEAAAGVAEELLDWAEIHEPETEADCSANTQGSVKAAKCVLFRIKASGDIRVSSQCLNALAERWGPGQIDQFVRDLRETGLRLDGGRPQGRLESVDAERYLVLMDSALESLSAGTPGQRHQRDACS